MPRWRRPFFALAALPLAIVCTSALLHRGQVAAASPAAAAAAAAASTMKPAIAISNYSFHPGILTVRKGSTVIWVNRDDDVHTIKSTDGPEAFNSPALDTGSRFGFTFHQAGTYRYTCSVHPYMHGVIVVR
ncbi:MAG: cupredoxin domain-containing protein [Gammaproteobacteria bacterium]|nr:cupredoxin domain-containing protein [Gammaproteobacteria bacterium]